MPDGNTPFRQGGFAPLHPPEKTPLFLAPLRPEPLRPRDGDGRIVEPSGADKSTLARLLVARALAGGPRVLIFDEATSALDNRTQATISRSLENIPATRVVIAHRLSTIVGADRILVLDDGALVEEGTYDGLLAKGGLFAELVRRQTI